DAHVELHFVRPLEVLAWEDWESALLDGASSGALFLLLHYRAHCSRDDRMRLINAYLTSWLVPLQDKRLVGGLFGGVGFFSISLFSMRDIPPEYLNVISIEEINRRLLENGCRPVEAPKTYKQ